MRLLTLPPNSSIGMADVNQLQPPAGPSRRARVRPDERRSYAVFGGVLQSELPFPELPELSDLPATPSRRADWSLRVAHRPSAPADAVLVGERTIGPERYLLWRTPVGWRLHFSHAGEFDINAGGSRIDWHPAPHAQLELARAVVLGPVMALCLESLGCLCLHGSGVAIGARAIAFLGAKRYGKSTLAVALAAAGARFVSDDLLAVAPDSPAMLRPGVAGARLWEDAARELRIEEVCARIIPGVKATAAGFPEPVGNALPLEAIYLLNPFNGEDEPPVRRTRLSGAAALIALSHQTKLSDSLVGYEAAGHQLRFATAVARSVPIHSLRIVRDFRRLPEVVETILRWHALPAAGEASSREERP